MPAPSARRPVIRRAASRLEVRWVRLARIKQSGSVADPMARSSIVIPRTDSPLSHRRHVTKKRKLRARHARGSWQNRKLASARGSSSCADTALSPPRYGGALLRQILMLAFRTKVIRDTACGLRSTLEVNTVLDAGSVARHLREGVCHPLDSQSRLANSILAQLAEARVDDPD